MATATLTLLTAFSGTDRDLQAPKWTRVFLRAPKLEFCLSSVLDNMLIRGWSVPPKVQEVTCFAI